MTDPFFLEEIDDFGIARIILTRNDVHNAFNDKLIANLQRSLESLEDDSRVRALVLAARGKSFSAGADLNWMQAMAGYSEAENLADAQVLAGLLATLNSFAKPTLALVQGPAYGGGVGLIACCDVALAAESACFALTEVRLGLIPAVISPYVMAAIGERAARRYVLTGETFSAAEAVQLGLIHEVVPDEQLEARGDRILTSLLKGGPVAQRTAKDLLGRLRGRSPDASVREETARAIAGIRGGEEGKEGLSAFLEKRTPGWRGD